MATAVHEYLNWEFQDGGQLRRVVVTDRALPALPLSNVVGVEAKGLLVSVPVLPALDLLTEPGLRPATSTSLLIDKIASIRGCHRYLSL